jgi:hypothetical protein
MCWSCDNEIKDHTEKAHMHDMSQPIGRLGTAAERFGMHTPLELVHAQQAATIRKQLLAAHPFAIP